MKLKIALVAASILTLAACASTPNDSKDGTKKVSKRSDMRCTAKMKIGSHISKKRCVSQKQHEQDKKNSQDQIRKLQNGARPKVERSQL